MHTVAEELKESAVFELDVSHRVERVADFTFLFFGCTPDCLLKTLLGQV